VGLIANPIKDNTIKLVSKRGGCLFPCGDQEMHMRVPRIGSDPGTLSVRKGRPGGHPSCEDGPLARTGAAVGGKPQGGVGFKSEGAESGGNFTVRQEPSPRVIEWGLKGTQGAATPERGKRVKRR